LAASVHCAMGTFETTLGTNEMSPLIKYVTTIVCLIYSYRYCMLVDLYSRSTGTCQSKRYVDVQSNCLSH
jgi:hypothetical protein